MELVVMIMWNFIKNIITNIMLYNNMVIEEKLEELVFDGCYCGNTDITKFTLIYVENNFSHIKCEACGGHIYPDKAIITTEMMKTIKGDGV